MSVPDVDVLIYEITMLFHSARRALNTNDLQDKNCFLESYAIHSRVLYDFFYGQGRGNSDVTADQFFSENLKWARKRPTIKSLRHLSGVATRTDKEVAHWTTHRSDSGSPWSIDNELNDMTNVIQAFVAHANRLQACDAERITAVLQSHRSVEIPRTGRVGIGTTSA